MRKLQIFAIALLFAFASVFPVGTPAQASECPSAFFMGLHGLDEDHTSDTVKAVWEAFSTRYGQTEEVVEVKHDVLTTREFLEAFGTLQNPIGAGVQVLDDEVSLAMATCSRAKIVLFGFSEGAWIVDAWLLQQDVNTLSYVAAVGVLGDPQYLRDDCCVGIARRLVGLPYPPKVPDRFWGNCANGDPICGGGYKDDPQRQFDDAWKLTSDCTPHCKVYEPAATQPMGEALADQTVRYPTP